MVFSKKQISVFIALLFHVSGAIGMLFSGYKEWFIAQTPLNLLLMTVLLCWNQEKINRSFLFFFALCFVTGMAAEITGTATGYLFGNYKYGTVMGPSFRNVPWLIGVYWFVIVFGSYSMMQIIHQRTAAWLLKKGETASRMLTGLSLVFDSAVLTVIFDWVMEPAAIQLGFWQWADGSIPLFNYISWFAVSVLLLLTMRIFKGVQPNHFAVHLYIIQLLFFVTLRIWL